MLILHACQVLYHEVPLVHDFLHTMQKTCTVICTVCILANSHIQTQIDAEKENKTYKPAICNLHDTRYYAAMLSIMICNMYLDISRRKQYKLIRLYCYYHSCARSFA